MPVNHVITTEGPLNLEKIKQFVKDCEEHGVPPKKEIRVFEYYAGENSASKIPYLSVGSK